MRVGFGSGRSRETDAVPSRRNRPDTAATVHPIFGFAPTPMHDDFDCDETNPLCCNRESEGGPMIQSDRARIENTKDGSNDVGIRRLDVRCPIILRTSWWTNAIAPPDRRTGRTTALR
ncbi:hypothetical protein VZT92_017051 [Zoarces viviparus]|uniref:Uncharacterized protein n=1 Tax=Zoarces viviparus TaxID=48416 RepID=A0AAW1ERL2_ZOAVI